MDSSDVTTPTMERPEDSSPLSLRIDSERISGDNLEPRGPKTAPGRQGCEARLGYGGP